MLVNLSKESIALIETVLYASKKSMRSNYLNWRGREIDAALAELEAAQGVEPDTRTFCYDDGSFGWLFAGDLEGLCYALKVNADELEDGDTLEFNIKRKDMTQAEIDALREV